jgi:two-component system alkaline phosphatase synthesis response regulator PhoP
MAYRDQEGGDRSGRRRRVLIVDDEPAIVDLLAFLFEDEGYEVLRAYDGEQGLRLAKRVHPDLVISDVSMPRLTGLDCSTASVPTAAGKRLSS